MKIADSERMTSAELDRWLAELRWCMGVDVFVAALVSRSRHARRKAEVWRKAPSGAPRSRLDLRSWRKS